ncbi:MAG TPA: flagellum-specific ATP synthase FliI, partial [Clostridiales bacterium]|nr:flagellum-specific ATP synthase FliI [Clostridiales bacterium]
MSNNINIDIKKYEKLLDNSYEKNLGKVVKVVGLTIESIGPEANLNDLCMIISKDGKNTVMAEVVGFRDNRILLMPFEGVDGIGIGSKVECFNEPLQVPVGEDLLGKVLNGLGFPLDESEYKVRQTYPVEANPPDPMQRAIISEVLPLGVKAVDALTTI